MQAYLKVCALVFFCLVPRSGTEIWSHYTKKWSHYTKKWSHYMKKWSHMRQAIKHSKNTLQQNLLIMNNIRIA